jgi:hypothetical protein
MKQPKKDRSTESSRELLKKLDQRIAEYEKKYQPNLSEDQLAAMFRDQYRSMSRR